jgi:thymidylate kinase
MYKMNNRVAIWKMPKTEDDDDLATKQEEANEKKRMAVAKKEALVKAYWEKIAKEQKETEVVNKNHNALSKSHAEVMQALDSFQTSL